MKWIMSFIFGVQMALFGAIYPAHSIDEIAVFFEHLDQDSLALFDVDMVLLEPENPAFRASNIEVHQAKAKTAMSGLSPGEKARFLSHVALCSGRQLVEEGMPAFIERLKDKGIKAICLTACLSGPLEKIASMSWWRLENLTAMGFDFSYSFPNHEKIEFTQFSEFEGSYPQFLKGILVANGGFGTWNKGKVLDAFFREIGWYPKKVVFLDDRKDNLDDVEDMLKELYPQIDFVGIHYLAASDKECQMLSEEAFSHAWNAIREKINLLKK